MQLSRRNFLKISSLFSASLIFDIKNHNLSFILNNKAVFSSFPLGRILYEGAQSYQEPSERSKVIDQFKLDEVIEISDPIIMPSEQIQQETWFQLKDRSYIKTQNLQPVQNILNIPRTEISKNGLLAEITVPFTTAYHNRKNIVKPNEIFYYGSLHWVYGLGIGPENQSYYLVREDRWGDGYYVDATHMRIIENEELSPISADVDIRDKNITISINDQLVIAYEKDQPVFLSSMASGLLTEDKDLSTPAGRYKINYKRPSRHMVHSDRAGSTSSALFGVPWVSYFTNSGIAFHGTYWHNDFTHPRSHGCINLPIPAARWLYLWTLPVVPAKEKTYVSSYGTPVEVI